MSKKIIDELLNINDELDLIDFLKINYRSKYEEIFTKEIKEKVKITRGKYYHLINNDNFDIRIYTLGLLKRKFSDDLRIDSYFEYLDIMKVIIFYENIIKLLERNRNNEEKNKEISLSIKIYNFFISLIGKNICILDNYKKVIDELKFLSLKQIILDNDSFKIVHNMFAQIILNNYLIPFIAKYKEMI